VLALKGRFEDAIAMYEERIRLNPNYAPTYYNMGRVYHQLGQPEKAIQYEEQAIRLSPRDARTALFYTVLAHAHMQLGDATKAIAAAEHGAPLSSSTQIAPRLALIAACVQGGQLERAEQLMREFRARHPKITVAVVRERERPGREAYQQYRERFYDALRKAGLPEG
jgi:tetratricopeptide (TPR) repeat protein